jgi:hypothetical protein
MNEQAGLERRYRRLLAAYPAAYRRRHEEEMLTVLLAGARPGQRRPELADVADLLAGAARMRLRLIQPYPGNAGADGLALFTVLAALLLAGPAIATLALHLVRTPPSGIPASLRPGLRDLLEARWAEIDAMYRRIRQTIDLAAAGQILIAIAVVLRLKRVALTLIAGILGWWLLLGGYGLLRVPFEELFLLCYLLEAAALLTSAGPRRGRQLLTWKSVTVLAAAAAVLTISWIYWMRLWFGDLGPSHTQASDLVAATMGLVAIGAAVALASRPARYLVSLYATVFYPVGCWLLRMAENDYYSHIPSLAVQLLPPLIAGSVIVIVACRRPADNRARRPGLPHVN